MVKKSFIAISHSKVIHADILQIYGRFFFYSQGRKQPLDRKYNVNVKKLWFSFHMYIYLESEMNENTTQSLEKNRKLICFGLDLSSFIVVAVDTDMKWKRVKLKSIFFLCFAVVLIST